MATLRPTWGHTDIPGSKDQHADDKGACGLASEVFETHTDESRLIWEGSRNKSEYTRKV